MTTLRMFKGRILFLTLIALVLPMKLSAVIIGNATDNGDGTYTYAYTVDNTTGAFDIFAWTLEFDLAPGDIDWNQLDTFSGGDVTVPTFDWIAGPGVPSVGGDSAQDFTSLFFLGDVLVGDSLSGFSFVSSHAPSTATFTIEFGVAGESAIGTTVGPGRPSAVPETGATLALLCLGVAGISFAGKRRHRLVVL